MGEFEEIISLRDAAVQTGYTTDYLGYLIRTGKLSGRKMGRTWVTTKRELDSYLSTSRYHAVTKLFSYFFNLKFMLFVSYAIIIVLAYILYFKPFSQPVQTTTTQKSDQIDPAEMDSDLHL